MILTPYMSTGKQRVLSTTLSFVCEINLDNIALTDPAITIGHALTHRTLVTGCSTLFGSLKIQ